MGNTGFINENNFLETLNNKKLKDLNKNLQELIKSTFNEVKNDTVIKCKKYGGTNKSDIEIIIGEETHTFSIKKGSGNSVHQEPIEDFICYLKKEFNINDVIANDLRFFIWGDGTYDSTGNVNERLKASELVKKYPEKIKNIQTLFDEKAKNLIKRFVVTGAKSTSEAEFIYYGTIENGIWCKSSDVVNWLVENKPKSNKGIYVGRLTFQAWNRNIKRGEKSEKKRGHIQLKWATIKNDLEEIRKYTQRTE